MKELISAEQLDAGIRKMAEQITSTVADRPLTVIGVLTGSVVLLADLIRQLKMPLRVGFVQASSYRLLLLQELLRIRIEWLHVLPKLTQES